jgi:hypothetical protein
MRIIILLILVATFSGCMNPKVVSYDAVQATARTGDGKTVYYCGTKEGYDYFFVESGNVFSIDQGTYYRVPTAESPVKSRFYFTKDQSLWERSVGPQLPTGKPQIFVPTR